MNELLLGELKHYNIPGQIDGSNSSNINFSRNSWDAPHPNNITKFAFDIAEEFQLVELMSTVDPNCPHQ